MKGILDTRFAILVATILLVNSAIAQQPGAVQIKAKKIKKITVTYSGDSEITPVVYIYYYDQNGNDTSLYTSGTKYSYKTITYDNNGRKLTEEKFFASGAKMEKTIFTYKPDGSFTAVNSDAQFGMKVNEAYDKRGNLLSHTIPDGTIIKYTYNAKGQKTSMYSIPIKGEKKFTVTYSYGPDGRMISSSRKGDPNSKTVYEYDKNGLLKKETTTTETGKSEKHKSYIEYSYE